MEMESLSMEGIERLELELINMTTNPPDLCTAEPVDVVDMHLWKATIEGPSNSPYESMLFHLSLAFPATYPLDPPKVKFLTPIYHPNIDRKGNVCINILKLPNWSSDLSVATVLSSISTLLTDPDLNPNNVLQRKIADLFLSNRSLFDENARQCIQELSMSHVEGQESTEKKQSLNPEGEPQEPKKHKSVQRKPRNKPKKKGQSKLQKKQSEEQSNQEEQQLDVKDQQENQEELPQKLEKEEEEEQQQQPKKKKKQKSKSKSKNKCTIM